MLDSTYLTDFENEIIDEFLLLLIKHSNGGKLPYWYALEIGRKYFNLNGREVRRMLVVLHAEGFWEWNGGKIKILIPK